MDLSILLPISPRRPEQVVPFANLVKWTSAERLWQGQALVSDSEHLANWLAGMGFRVPCGFGVSLMPLRSPYLAAVQARSVAISTGQSVVAGFGPGALQFQRAVLGKPYASQLGASREYLQAVRGLLSGEVTELDGDYFSIHARLAGFHQTPVTLGLGVLREKMATLAGEIADVAVTWLGSADYLGDVLMPAIRNGAAQRELPERTKVTAVVPVAVSREGRSVTDLVQESCGTHLRMPHYQAALARSGVTVDGDGSDADARKLVDAGAFLFGTVEEIHKGLERYRDIGVDEVVLNATGVATVAGQTAAATDLLEIIRADP